MSTQSSFRYKRALQSASHHDSGFVRLSRWWAARKQEREQTLQGHLLSSVQSPVLDTEGKFLFFAINKNAQTSVVRNALASRAIVNKDNPKHHWDRLVEVTNDLDNVYKFAIVRNPWDRFVSTFEYLRKHKMIDPHLSFDDFVTNGDFSNPHFNLQHPNFQFQGRVFVDDLFHLEELAENWRVIAERLGIGSELPFANRSRTDRDYRNRYSERSLQIVSEVYQSDIEALNYEFESLRPI